MRARLNVQRIQLIDPFINRENIYKPYDRLPQFSFNTDTALPLGFELALKGELTAFDRELDEARLTPDLMSVALWSPASGPPGTQAQLVNCVTWLVCAGERLLSAHAVSAGKSGHRHTGESGTRYSSLQSGLWPVLRPQATAGRSQTLEPRIFYLYSEFKDQSEIPVFDSSELNFSFSQLFREDRFSGGDRTSNADQVTLAITTRVLNANGEERFRASLGQLLYFEDRLVSLRILCVTGITAMHHWRISQPTSAKWP